MMHRPQHTEAAQRLEARTARTFEAPPCEGVGGCTQTIAPRAAKRKPLAAEVRARSVPPNWGSVQNACLCYFEHEFR